MADKKNKKKNRTQTARLLAGISRAILSRCGIVREPNMQTQMSSPIAMQLDLSWGGGVVMAVTTYTHLHLGSESAPCQPARAQLASLGFPLNP